jgi:hypothetical protein
MEKENNKSTNTFNGKTKRIASTIPSQHIRFIESISLDVHHNIVIKPKVNLSNNFIKTFIKEFELDIDQSIYCHLLIQKLNN